MIKEFFKKISEKAEDCYREYFLPLNIHHVYGPRKINYAKNGLVVICLVYNGEACIRDYVRHYLDLGVKHIVFLDNNSTDKTIEIARNTAKLCRHVTILKTKEPVRNDKEECRLKRYLAKRFCKGRWCLCADVDEFFDYPYSDVLSLGGLLGYLNKNRYTAVVAHMLDMFSDKPLNHAASIDSVKEIYNYYDIENIKKIDYFEAANWIVQRGIPINNILSNKNIKFYTGGIRKTVFNIDSWLIKHSLFFLDNRLNPLPHSHFVSSARIADFSAVLYHYKFNKDFYESSLKYIRDNIFTSCLFTYEGYVKKIEENPSLILKQKTSKKLKSVNDLVKNGFLAVSENYKKYAGEMKK